MPWTKPISSSITSSFGSGAHLPARGWRDNRAPAAGKPFGEEAKSSCGLASGRQPEPECGPAGGVGRSPQPSAVALDDRLTDRKPHSHATGLGRVKGIKQVVQGGHIESGSGIAYRHEHAIRPVFLRGNTAFAASELLRSWLRWRSR